MGPLSEVRLLPTQDKNNATTIDSSKIPRKIARAKMTPQFHGYFSAVKVIKYSPRNLKDWVEPTLFPATLYIVPW